MTTTPSPVTDAVLLYSANSLSVPSSRSVGRCGMLVSAFQKQEATDPPLKSRIAACKDTKPSRDLAAEEQIIRHNIRSRKNKHSVSVEKSVDGENRQLC